MWRISSESICILCTSCHPPESVSISGYFFLLKRMDSFGQKKHLQIYEQQVQNWDCLLMNCCENLFSLELEIKTNRVILTWKVVWNSIVIFQICVNIDTKGIKQYFVLTFIILNGCLHSQNYIREDRRNSDTHDSG